jgi:phage FluMu protein Com
VDELYVKCPNCIIVRRALTDMISLQRRYSCRLIGRLEDSEQGVYSGYVSWGSLSIACPHCKGLELVLTDSGRRLKALMIGESEDEEREIPL